MQLKPRLMEKRRLRLIRKLEKETDHRIISIIQQPGPSTLLSLLSGRHIGIRESQKILKAIRETPSDKPIDLVLHTPGGLSIASQQIVRALLNHEAEINAYVPHHAVSAGTLLALAADNIYLDKNAILGRVDPQIFGFPAASVEQVTEEKSPNEIDDKTLMLADVSRKALRQAKDFAQNILEEKGYSSENKEKIIHQLLSGDYTHDHPVSYAEAEKMALKVKPELPDKVYRLVEISADTRQQLKTVQYRKI